MTSEYEYDLSCAICGDEVGVIGYDDPLSDDQLAARQFETICGICGPLLETIGGDRSQAWTRATLTQAAAIAIKTSQLITWLDQQYATPFVINSISLAVDPDSQARLTALYAAENGAVQYGGAQLTDTTGLVDSNGVWQSMTVQSLFTTLLSYAASCKAIAQQYATLFTQIQAASDQAALDAITW